MMTAEKIQALKSTYLDSIKNLLNETGGLSPHITVFAEHKAESLSGESAIVHVPIPDEFMKSDKDKQQFVDVIIPQFADKLNETYTAEAVVWASEAWVRTATPDQKIDDYKSLPIEKEVLIIVYESNYDKELQIYEMLRKGKQVNSNGELVDAITLVYDKEMSGQDYPTGRFTGLLKKFQKVN